MTTATSVICHPVYTYHMGCLVQTRLCMSVTGLEVGNGFRRRRFDCYTTVCLPVLGDIT